MASGATRPTGATPTTRKINPVGTAHPMTLEEHVRRGTDARKEMPPEQHAPFSTTAGRRDPVEILEEQGAARVPELVPIRYGRMLVSPFTFYRGAAAVMAADLAETPTSGLTVQLCGDAHLSNFGAFASPERRLVFDINDFDETFPGPWEWDVKRLAASFAIAGRELGFTAEERRAVVLATMRSYREAMAAFAGMRNLEVWYSYMPVERAFQEFSAGVDRKRLKKGESDIAKARTILQGRYAVSIEDIQALAPSVLRHRIFPNFRAQGEGLSSVDIISRLLSEVKPFEDGKAAR